MGSESENNGNRGSSPWSCNVDLESLPETRIQCARDESNHVLGPGLNPNTGKDEKDGDQPRKIGEKQVLQLLFQLP